MAVVPMPSDRRRCRTNATAEAYVTYGAVLVIHDTIETQSVHAHRPYELIVAIDGPFRYKIADGGIKTATALLVPPMVRHAIFDYGGRIARVYLDPGSRRVSARHTTVVEMQDPHVSSRVQSFFTSDRSIDDARMLITSWQTSWAVSFDETALCEPRVARVLEVLNDRVVPTADRFSVARLVGLSPSRFAALFVEQTGVPLRRYIAWRRLLLAARLIREGYTIAQAAAEAGFSDHAHLSRSYRSTFGSSPSHLQMITIAPNISKR